MQRYEGIWLKRHLLPAWIIQIIGVIIYAILAALLLATATYIDNNPGRRSNHSYYGSTADDFVRYARIAGGVVLALSLGTLIIDIVEIVLFARHVLNPVILLTFACLKTGVWGVWFVYTIIASAGGSFSAANFIISAALVLTSVMQLVYGATYTHRKRKELLPNRKSAGIESGHGGYKGR